ncbi:MAG: toll/interleukin-1 receptor domain-containing protein [Cyanobacteriota bacterium]
MRLRGVERQEWGARSMIRDKVFISYAHADKKWLNLLLKHLKPLIREGLNVWSDQDILPGQQWPDEIDQSLASAKVAVLLLSADFLASDFIQDKEVPRFLPPAMNGQVIILPVLISPCRWDRSEICRFQSPINPKEPLQSLQPNEREQALVDIVTAIESAWKRQACGQSFPEEEASRVALKQFRALAVRHGSMSAERVEDAFRRAVRVCHADSSLQKVFPKLSTQQALGWTALNDFFTEQCRPDPALVQALAAELAAPVSQPLNPREGASSSSVLQALKELVDTLVQAIEPSRFDDLLADMQEEEIGRAIVKTLAAGSHESRCKRLVQNSAKYDEAGFDVLWEVLNINVDPSLAIRPRLEKAFAAYRDAKRKEVQSCQPRISSCLEDQARPGRIQKAGPPAVPPAVASVYISYAWGDDTPEGQRRARLVDQLYAAVKAAGIPVLIDREEVKPGDRISSFMQAIAKGDVVIIILSQKYLESENCIYELNEIWKESSQDPVRFLPRVIPLTLPDANLKSTEDIFLKSQYWKRRWQDLEGKISQNTDIAGREIFAKFKDMQQFAHQLGDILVLLNDKCEPRDFDRQAREGFREVIDQILAVKQGGGAG